MFVRRIYGLLAVLEPCYNSRYGEVIPLIADHDGSGEEMLYIAMDKDTFREAGEDRIHEVIDPDRSDIYPLYELVEKLHSHGFPEGWTEQGERFLFHRVSAVLGRDMKQPTLCWQTGVAWDGEKVPFLSCIDLDGYEEVAVRYTRRTERRLYFDPELPPDEDLICLEWDEDNPIPYRVDCDEYDMDRMYLNREDMYNIYCIKRGIELDDPIEWEYEEDDEEEDDDQEDEGNKEG